MTHLLHEMERSKKYSSIFLSRELTEIFDDGFVRAEGCTFFKRLYNSSVSGRLSLYSDRTGYECFVNHVHIDSYVEADEDNSSMHLLDHGVSLCLLLKEKLEESYPREPFRLILAFENQDCSLRFHKIRPNENWIDDNLENYSEAIMVLDAHENIRMLFPRLA